MGSHWLRTTQPGRPSGRSCQLRLCRPWGKRLVCFLVVCSSRSSLAYEFQRLAFFEVKVFGFCPLLDWLCLERCNSGGNVFGIHAGGHGRLRFERWQFVLHLLSVLCANLEEGGHVVDC